MRGRTVAGLSLAASVGLIAFILVQMSSLDRGGADTGASAAASSATACVETDDADCLPGLAMEDIDGNSWDAEALAGKVVIVNIWATWCRPCLIEIPYLAEVYDRYRERDVVLLGLMTDQPSSEDLAAFSERTGLNYPVVRANTDILHAFGLPDVLPTTYVYDRGGHMVLRHQGLITAEVLSDAVEELLEQAPPEPDDQP